MKMSENQKDKKKLKYMISKQKDVAFRRLTDSQKKEFFIKKYDVDEK